MVPRPEISHRDRYNAVTHSLISPTTVTNHYREPPKSPRHPRALSDRHRQGYQCTPEQVCSQKVEAGNMHPHKEMGKFVNNSGSNDNADKHHHVDSPHQSKERILGDLLTFYCHDAAASDLSAQNTKQYTPVANKKMDVWLEHTSEAAGDFAATAAEIYRLECKSGNRDDYLKEKGYNNVGGQMRSMKKNEMGACIWLDDNSLTETGSLVSDENMTHSDVNSGGNKSKRPKGKIEQSRSPPGKTFDDARYSRRMRFVEEDPLMDVSPPRGNRTIDVNRFDPTADNENLMDASMELLGFGQDGVLHAQGRRVRALQDFHYKDSGNDGWKRELKLAQQHLDDALAGLGKTKKESQETQYWATEIRARTVQERKKLQDMYEKQLEQKKMLELDVSKLRHDVSVLKLSLRNSRTFSSTNEANSSQIISMKAEIADLRSRLQEAYTTNVERDATCYSVCEIDELRTKLTAAEERLAEFGDKELYLEKIQTDYDNATSSLNKKIERMESEAQSTQNKLGQSLKTALEDANQVRAELIKCKANLHRLERERSRKRINVNSDVDRLTSLLLAAKEEVKRVQDEAKDERRSADEASEKLQNELSDLKKKFANISYRLASKAVTSSEYKRKIDVKLEGLQHEVNELKLLLESRDAKILLQARRIAELQMSP